MTETPDELYRALGKALARWQYIEIGMFLLFHGLKGSPFKESSHAFFETDRKKLHERKKLRGEKDLSTIGKKLWEINNLCKAHLSPEIITKRWEPLHTELKQRRDIRNAIAHFEPGRFHQSSGDALWHTRLGISPQVLDLTRVTDGRIPVLYVDQILEAAKEFLTTAQALITFTEAHVPDWGDRVSVLPPHAHVAIEDIMKTQPG